MDNTENDSLSDKLYAHLERGRRLFLASKKHFELLENDPSIIKDDKLVEALNELRISESAYKMINEDLFPRIIDELETSQERLDECEKGAHAEIARTLANWNREKFNKFWFSGWSLITGVVIGIGYAHFFGL